MKFVKEINEKTEDLKKLEKELIRKLTAKTIEELQDCFSLQRKIPDII